MSHPAAASDEALLLECEFRRGRASGPGGQHRNKVETEVTLIHRPTGFQGHAAERRSQSENKAVALWRLRLTLALEVRSVCGEQPSDLWRGRVHGTRLRVNPEHADYPALLAEAFDVIADCHWEPSPAAAQLGVSSTQLVRFVADHPAAFERWNRVRDALGKHRLKP